MSQQKVRNIKTLDLLEEVEEFSHVGGWDYNLMSGEITWTKETYRIHGLEPGVTLSVDDAINYYVPHERERIQGYIEKAIADKSVFDSEFEFIDHQGIHKWVRSYGRAVLDENSQVIGLRGFFQDVTKQKKLSLALIEKNKSLASYELGLNKYAIVVKTDNKGKIVYVNDKFCEISKYERDELVGRDHRILNSGYHPKAFFKKMWSSISQGDQWRGKIKNKAKDGSYYWVDTTITPIFDDSGEVKEFLAFRFDITKEKEYESIIKKERDHAKKLARVKSDFLANMSHEIRTPMNGIMGMLSLLEDTSLNPEQQEMLINAKISSNSLLVLLNDILDFSKCEYGKIIIAHEKFDLRETLSNLYFMYKKLAGDQGYPFHFCISDSILSHYVGDVYRIRQVLSNLLSNAVKFTKRGHVKLSVDSFRGKGGENYLRFIVEDTGLGIKKDYHQALFDAFTQEDVTTSRRFGGSGLGLSICKKLTRAMNGHIFFCSEEGRGTTFSFSLPLQGWSDEKEGKLVFKGMTNLNEKVPLSILLAEDNHMNKKVIEGFLNKLGYRCDYAENGVAAVEMAECNHYDLILMDMQMPVMDGVSATRTIIERLGSQSPAIVALTANAFDSDRQECLDAGMCYFIEKPLRKSSLINMIETVFAKRFDQSA